MFKNLSLLKIKLILGILSIALLVSCKTKEAQDMTAQEPNTDWAFYEFSKVDSINPILNPSAALEFTDPISGNSAKWEERNVLNPTAVVKDGKVYLMYRAQDINGTSLQIK